ncbi:hypothetical protein ACFOYW_10715 [Gryllotalpicola reticulitermitis]|uniref:Alpha/beta hydrolase n=1 Tax=Gryllotalpicola reticulitermitis TaxID=1184153 RepID=A0ABV8Q945_9MICO
MPVIAPTPTTPEYPLVVFDAEGREVAEADGSALSESVAARIAAGGVTDVVLLCHGWLDALADAESAYHAWLETAHPLAWPGPVPPLVIGAHWPSTPLATGEPPDVPAELEAHLADGTLATAVANAGSDIADFLSFWTMRQRAITLGSSPTGLARLVSRVFSAGSAAGGTGIRLHLVGHSLGCIALSGALSAAGAAQGPHAATLFLAQAAESSWAFSARAPFLTGGTGKYHAVVDEGLVDGALVATRSTHDEALGVWYRLGMEFVLQRSYAAAAPGQPARAAAIGAEGLGFDPSVPTAGVLPPLVPGATHFALAAGHQYSIDGSALIASHADVDHIEIARLFFEAVAVVTGGRSPTPR